MELPSLSLTVVLPAAGFGLTAGRVAVPPNVLIRRSLSISGSQHDLELIELIPLGVGPLSLWNRQKSLQASTGGKRLRFIHGRIISSFDIVRAIKKAWLDLSGFEPGLMGPEKKG